MECAVHLFHTIAYCSIFPILQRVLPEYVLQTVAY
jgi:hypothetical protein